MKKARMKMRDIEKSKVADLNKHHLALNVSATPQMSVDMTTAIYNQTGNIYIKRNDSIVLNIVPVPKPRMVKSDAWRKRKCVLAYWSFKDQLTTLAAQVGLTDLPASNFHVTYWMPMPASWPKKKKAEMNGQPHQQKPDGDNLQKALQDCLCKSDEHIWDFRVTKRWATTGRIEIKIAN